MPKRKSRGGEDAEASPAVRGAGGERRPKLRRLATALEELDGKFDSLARRAAEGHAAAAASGRSGAARQEARLALLRFLDGMKAALFTGLRGAFVEADDADDGACARRRQLPRFHWARRSQGR